VLTGRVISYTSVPILLELEDVLTRKKFAAKFASIGRTPSDVVRLWQSTCRVVEPVSMKIAALRDPKDVMLVECAVSARVEYLVSGDRDLQALDRYGNLHVISPADFLSALSREAK